jgi:diacylglycerol kinase
LPRKLIKSFRHARAGAAHAFRTQRNLWIHFVVGIAVLLVAGFLKITLLEFSILTIVIFLVISLELVNTAIEELVNILSPGHQLQAKLAKDVAAAAVLLGALGAVMVGGIIFIPKILRILGV